MANYTLDEFKTHAANGDPILITKKAGRTDVVLQIGGVSVQLTEDQQSVSVVNGVKSLLSENKTTIDLGTQFTAKQVLDSVSLKRAIAADMVYASVGSAALSLEPHTV